MNHFDNPFDSFIQRFLQRFEGQFVPLLHLLDEEAGISFSSEASYQAPLLSGITFSKYSESTRAC